MSIPLSFGPAVGTSAAEHLPPAFPERAARGTADKLRAWQAEALQSYFEHEPRDFLVAATPGSGKTTFALRLAAEGKALPGIRHPSSTSLSLRPPWGRSVGRLSSHTAWPAQRTARRSLRPGA